MSQEQKMAIGMTTTTNTTTTTTTGSSSPCSPADHARKPRRSVKAEGSILNTMLRQGDAKVIDASKLGKRLSSEIWNSFGAIQVETNFAHPRIDTKTVADGTTSMMKICQFFVACSKCFSVFKYDGHAYGTTGLVKHVKICQGTNQQQHQLKSVSNSSSSGFTPNSTGDHNKSSSGVTHTPTSSSSVPIGGSTASATTTSTTNTPATTNSKQSVTNGPVSTRRRRETSNSLKNRNQSTPSVRHLAKVIEELRCEQIELKQKIIEMISLMNGTAGYVGQIQIISNEGDKVEDELQKND